MKMRGPPIDSFDSVIQKLFVQWRHPLEFPMQPRPTDSELAILSVLWERGASTVKEVHQSLYPGGEVNYNTTLKFLQIMLEKGLVTRDESSRQHVYAAKKPKEATRTHLVKDMLGRAFGGDTQALLMSALEAQPASEDELQAMEALLRAARKKREQA